MNNLILIKSGPYTGQKVMADKVPAQDGLRYCCQIDGKTIGFRPNEVVVLPDDHPLAKKMEKRQEDINQALQPFITGIWQEKEPTEPKPKPLTEIQPADPVPVKKRRGRPRKILSDSNPAPQVDPKPEKPAQKGIPAADAIEQAINTLQGPKRKPIDIVIDFDGTVVTHEFPNIGRDIGAVPVLKELVDNGHRLILFTMRSDIDNPVSNNPNIHCQGGKYLSDALAWFKRNDIPLYGIQTNPDQKKWTHSPKAYGQIIIDDAALGCPLQYKSQLSGRPFVDWIKVRRQLVSMRLLDHRDPTSKLF